MVKIYTKKGDNGQTSAIGYKMSKGDKLADVLGSIDELNSWIGVCREHIAKFKLLNSIDKELKRMQKCLMTIASVMAGGKKYNLGFMNYEVRRLEKLIDKLTEEMPELNNFIYPIGYLQMTRAIARRMERETVKYVSYDLRFTNKTVLKYMNRLSDVLFTMGRWVNYKTGLNEEVWK